MSTCPRIPVRAPIVLDLPRELEMLYEIAYNLWWTWSPEARRLFSAIHSWAWSRYHNPIELMLGMDRHEWDALLEDHTFMADFGAVRRSFEAYLKGGETSWFATRYPEHRAGPVAYFSMEYGLHASLGIYSGGLGVLSGDHCKSASDLGLPFVAIGLLYRTGYFRQTIDADGFQQHTYPETDFVRVGLRPVAGTGGGDLLVRVPFPGREVTAKVWTVQIGRVPLLLLDTDTNLNDAADRPITNVLYVRGREMRLAQELVLGVGGARALEALGIEPAVWHLNEGHSSLLQLERLLRARERDGVDLDEALAAVRATSVFTTHTPVPAGHETFEPPLARRYLEPLIERLGVPAERLLALGNADHGEPDQPFNLTALALRTSAWTNGVSRLNAEISDHTWRHLRPAETADQRLVEAITNGVHLPTWIGLEMRDLLTRHVGLDWRARLASPEAAAAIEAIPDEELWDAHQEQKRRLARFTRGRLLAQFARHGRSPDELRAIADLLDPEVLTLGFARRFATYKRASLLFSDLHRVRTLLTHPERPVQVIVAGKAHPADRPGQELIQHLFNLGQDVHLRGRVIFIENYDFIVAHMMVQGVDVWLNTPRRPLEASGTSGMKAAINGVLHCSILDGWWPEAYDGANGWAIEGGEHPDDWSQDREDALALYEVVERQVVSTFYQRDERRLPRRWLTMMKHSIATVAPHFSSDRMVREYTERAYLPLAVADAGVALASGRQRRP
ncbi:MAG TPA: alpha-glucan family phosphorylase [Thermoanaerobaculia bacterium]|nr:alpha-glucan family phosphorylase [Thermoanaerobaculia bacterium]